MKVLIIHLRIKESNMGYNRIIFYIIILVQIILVYPIHAQNNENIELSELIREYDILHIKNNEEVCWNEIEIFFTMEYAGSQHPAEMLFMSNSIMVLRSYFYSLYPQRENRFFAYSLNNNILKILFIDPRIDVSRHLEVTISHMDLNRDILFVDGLEKSITYDISQDRILFGGFYFYSEENRFVLSLSEFLVNVSDMDVVIVSNNYIDDDIIEFINTSNEIISCNKKNIVKSNFKRTSPWFLLLLPMIVIILIFVIKKRKL